MPQRSSSSICVGCRGTCWYNTLAFSDDKTIWPQFYLSLATIQRFEIPIVLHCKSLAKIQQRFEIPIVLPCPPWKNIECGLLFEYLFCVV